MTLIQALILGVIQGITEFFPVSSSGHLVLAQKAFNIVEENLFFDTVVHLGTAFAILIVFRKDITDIFKGLLSKEADKRKSKLFYVACIVAATIPAAFVGVFFKDSIESAFMNAGMASFMLIVTGVLLFLTMMRNNGVRQVTILSALVIGSAQAFAIFPGISRSGSTIAAALLIGVSRKEAGRFSFLLALPAIFGAMVLQLDGISGLSISPAVIVSGFLASFAAGLVSLKLLLGFVKSGKMHYFSYYCFFLGAAALIIIYVF